METFLQLKHWETDTLQRPKSKEPLPSTGQRKGLRFAIRIHVVIRASDSTCAIPRSAGTRASVPTSAAAPCTAERKSRTVGGAQIAYCRLMTTRVTPSEGGAKDTRPACTATKISQAVPSFDSLTTVSRCWCGGNGFELPTI